MATESSELFSRKDTMFETDDKKNAFMDAWLAYKELTDAQDREFADKQEEIGSAVATLVQEMLGKEKPMIEGREDEFGRVLGNVFRTLQTLVPYHHQGNDGLIKEQLKWYEFGLREDLVDKIIEHDVESMRNILGERGGWAAQTGRLELALDALTTPTCFRDLVLGEGFELNPTRLAYKSPYGRVIEMGHKRGIWTNLTEERIHNIYTIPRYKGYADIMSVHFEISPWDEESRMITVEVFPLGEAP